MLRLQYVLAVASIACASSPATTPTARERSAIPVWGLEFPVSDVDEGVRFYQQVCGFDVESCFGGESDAVLANGEFRLVLRRTSAQASLSVSPCLNLSVGDARAGGLAAKALGAEVPALEPRRFPLGRVVEARDPFGNALHFIELDGQPASARPHVFDVSIEALDLAAAQSFLASLGYEVHSREHLPSALPLERHGAAALVLVPQKLLGEGSFVARGAVLFAVESFASAILELHERGIELAAPTRTRTIAGRAHTLLTPAGLPLKLVERSPARLAFERIRQLAGTWEGKSTRGWTDRLSLRVIARGSAVLETSFDAHPGETMATLFHMDGERLMLTHYCVAGNQPRLVATRFDEGGRRVTFEFLDGGDLDSRDEGHMDELVMTFPDAAHFTSRWTWYQAGRESWMEEIEHVRALDGSPDRARASRQADDDARSR